MADIKFSQFTEQVDPADVQFLVGYNGSDNVRIEPSNIADLSGYLPLTGGALTGALEVADNTTITGNGLYVGYNNNGTNFIQVGRGRSTDGVAYFDLIGDSTYNDYGLRITRQSGGANASSRIIHRGTGVFIFSASEAASMSFKTSGSERLRIASGGNVGIGTTLPASKLEVDGGDIEVDDSARGLILRSPNGTRYRIQVDNSGNLTTTAV